MLWTVLNVFTCVDSQGRCSTFSLSLIAAFVSWPKSPVFVKLELAQNNNKIIVIVGVLCDIKNEKIYHKQRET